MKLNSFKMLVVAAAAGSLWVCAASAAEMKVAPAAKHPNVPVNKNLPDIVLPCKVEGVEMSRSIMVTTSGQKPNTFLPGQIIKWTATINKKNYSGDYTVKMGGVKNPLMIDTGVAFNGLKGGNTCTAKIPGGKLLPPAAPAVVK